MKVLLTIGYTQLLLPNDTGVNTLMRALSQAMEVEDLRYKNAGFVARRLDRQPEIKMEYIKPGTPLHWPPGEEPRKKPLALDQPGSIQL